MAESKRGRDEAEVQATIADMPQPDRGLAERIHALVTAAAPELAPKLWYGQPAYAKGGKVVCFFRSGQKDDTRYSTFGFNDVAQLDDGGMWPTSYAVTELAKADEAAIEALVKRAVG